MLFGKVATEIKEDILEEELSKCENDEDRKRVTKDIDKIVRDYFTDKQIKSIERIENECATLSKNRYEGRKD